MKFVIYTGIFFYSLFHLNAYAWDNHSFATRTALSVLPEVQSLGRVKVESLEEFLVSVQAKLPAVLEEEEQWARKNVPEYPARPDSLRFLQGKGGARAPFMGALRVNPRMPLA